MALADAFWATVGLLFGVGFVWAALRSLRQSWTVLSTPRTDARDVTAGPVRLHGTVRAGEEAVAGPLTGTRCALARWEIRQGTGTGRLETELASGYDAAPFRLEDGTGAVEVAVTGERELFDLDIELGSDWDDPIYEVPYSEERPEPAAALESAADVHDWATGGASVSERLGVKRRYHEWRVETGDEVTVYGEARETPAGTVVEPGETFVLATGDLARTLQFRTLVFLLAAAFFLGGSFAVLGWL
ncbi:MAG: hypothetical protein ABEJ23_08540 [Haloarculaceae archaeon]